MNNSEKISAILNERSILRSELIGFEGSMHKSLFAFVTAVTAFISLYLKKDLFKDSTISQEGILLIISQVEFLLALHVLSLSYCASIALAYISALEAKINYLAKDKISIWESEMVKEFHHKPYSSFMVSMTAQVVFLISIFVWSLSKLQKESSGCGICLLGILELGAIIFMIIVMLTHRRRAYSHAIEKLGLAGQ